MGRFGVVAATVAATLAATLAALSLPVGAWAQGDVPGNRPLPTVQMTEGSSALTTDDAGVEAPYGCMAYVSRPRLGTHGNVRSVFNVDCDSAGRIEIKAVLFRTLRLTVKEPCQAGTSTRYRAAARFTVDGRAGSGGANVFRETAGRIAC